MYKIGICGHFGGKKEYLDGQTIKTKIMTQELEKRYSTEKIFKIDTYNIKLRLIIVILKLIFMVKVCKNIIVFPGKNGIRLLIPLLVIINTVYKRNLNYVVIGGWLPEFLERRNYLKNILKKFNYIYVETYLMKKKLKEIGLNNIVVMPNCKDLKILDEKELVYSRYEPLKICTFSRVLKEKGIEDAINATITVNKFYNKVVYTLDIFGQIDSQYEERFKKLQVNFPKFIKYRGTIKFDKSTDILKEYYLLLFPTYYGGEGLAGTIIDAYSAGLPVLASDWRYNSEIVKNYKTGLIFKNQSLEDLTNKLKECYENIELVDFMRKECILEAQNYQPSNVIKILLKNLV